MSLTRTQANKLLSVMLLALAEGEAPEGVMYAAMMNDVTLGDFNALIDIAKSVGLITVQHHLVTITDKGREMAKKIQASVAS